MGKASRRRQDKRQSSDESIEQSIRAAMLFNKMMLEGVEFRKSTTPVAIWNRAIYNARHDEYEAYAHMKADGDEWLCVYDSRKKSPVALLGEPDEPHPADEV